MSLLAEELHLLHREFLALKQEGVDRLAISDESLGRLQGLVDEAKASLEGGKRAAPRGGLPEAASSPLAAVVEEPSAPREKSLPVLDAIALPEGSAQEQWQWLQEQLHADAVYSQHLPKGKALVMGVGAVTADILFCGEAPGAEEEAQLEPFVGPAGQLQTKIIQAMGLSREAIYLANALYWRPDTENGWGNRPPHEQEIVMAQAVLQAQLDIVRPKVIVALGATAVHSLLGYDKKRKLGQVRGRWLERDGIPVMTTYHPSYLIRNNSNKTKRMVWEDMMLVMEHLQMPISDKQRTYFS